MTQITPDMTRKLRACLLRDNERVRIKKNGEVHAFGRMPNTNHVGWYLVGFENELIEQRDYFTDAK